MAESEGYDAFVKKFERKKTTDDCYTPECVYDTVADWVAKRYGVDSTNFVRPFWPDTDYQLYNYKADDIVVDNPPFSILASIVDWYLERGVKFFLFCPALVSLSAANTFKVCHVYIGHSIRYENGACVKTAFVTNLNNDGAVVETAPDLDLAIVKVQKQEQQVQTVYKYPKELLTSSNLIELTRRGGHLKITKDECVKVSRLDAQKPHKKSIYGYGLLLNADATERRKQAEKSAKQLELDKKEDRYVWDLSERELKLLELLDKMSSKSEVAHA